MPTLKFISSEFRKGNFRNICSNEVFYFKPVPKSLLICKGNDDATVMLNVALPLIPCTCRAVVIGSSEDLSQTDHSLDVPNNTSGRKTKLRYWGCPYNTFDWIVSFLGFCWNKKTRECLAEMRKGTNVEDKGYCVFDTKDYLPSLLRTLLTLPKWAPYAAEFVNDLRFYENEMAKVNDLQDFFNVAGFYKLHLFCSSEETSNDLNDLVTFKEFAEAENKQLKLKLTELDYHDLMEDFLQEINIENLVIMEDGVCTKIKIPVNRALVNSQNKNEEL